MVPISNLLCDFGTGQSQYFLLIRMKHCWKLLPSLQVWHGSKRNLMLRSWLTKEDVRTVVREEWERAKSDLAEYFQSSMENALKEIMQQISSTKNAVPKKKEAVELANIHSPHLGRANAESTANNNGRNLQLQFRTKLSLPLFTGKKLEGEGGACISVALIDVNTGYVVTSGPESSIKLDVVVLEGDFNKEDEDNWAQEEFEKYMVKEREGKRPLLTGDLQVKLKGGVGELGDLTFTDNSSWNKSKRFRIGLKVASDYCGDTRIQEAKTDAFPVKEHRGEANKKSYPPKPDDEVWRLEKIAKDGKSHKKLSEARIHKVEDFVLQLIMDPVKLRQILGKSITPKNWDSLVLHARDCKINRKLCLYYMDSMRKDGALLDADDQLIGLIIDRVYVATHQLSAREKEYGDTIVKKVLDNNIDVMEFNGETLSPSMQKKSSSSLTPQICAAQGGLEAPLANVGLTAEGQSQNTNFGNDMDEGVPVASHQRISADQNAYFGNAMMSSVYQPIPADNSNVPFYPGDDGITNVGLPNESHGITLQEALGSQMIDAPSPGGYIINEHVLSTVPISSCQYSSTCPPEANHVTKDFWSTMSDDLMELWR
ncbi:calmodulin-binding protein 60 D-like isoform X3 [Syzygium oleosum]|uniref:calmodulin-binding protein 60 D-like isoform X3 n=1 Tax=Syzygium oleosum TaxID=219896 RepID=UPI0024B8C62C|nr:calmodulin-binding protein 60 D-like isoform X3 [Syzygium oleosum]